MRRLAVAENMQEGTVAFLWQFSLQNEVGLQMYADMAQLCHCGSTFVSGIEVRRERSSRSQLANLSSKVLYNNCAMSYGGTSDINLAGVLGIVDAALFWGLTCMRRPWLQSSRCCSILPTGSASPEGVFSARWWQQQRSTAPWRMRPYTDAQCQNPGCAYGRCCCHMALWWHAELLDCTKAVWT